MLSELKNKGGNPSQAGSEKEEENNFIIPSLLHHSPPKIFSMKKRNKLLHCISIFFSFCTCSAPSILYLFLQFPGKEKKLVYRFLGEFPYSSQSTSSVKRYAVPYLQLLDIHHCSQIISSEREKNRFLLDIFAALVQLPVVEVRRTERPWTSRLEVLVQEKCVLSVSSNDSSVTFLDGISLEHMNAAGL